MPACSTRPAHECVALCYIKVSRLVPVSMSVSKDVPLCSNYAIRNLDWRNIDLNDIHTATTWFHEDLFCFALALLGVKDKFVTNDTSHNSRMHSSYTTSNKFTERQARLFQSLANFSHSCGPQTRVHKALVLHNSASFVATASRGGPTASQDSAIHLYPWRLAAKQCKQHQQVD